MKVTINHYAYGRYLAIGSVPKEIWDYIQDKYEGNVAHYMDDLSEDGKIPDEFRLAADMAAVCQNTDLFYECAGSFEDGLIKVTNDEGEVIYETYCPNLEEFEKLGVIKLNITRRIIDPSVRYISVFSCVEKGLFRTGEFELEGEFDPTKLTILCTAVEYGKDSDVFIVGFKYAGKSIDCKFGDTYDVAVDVDIIDTKADED